MLSGTDLISLPVINLSCSVSFSSGFVAVEPATNRHLFCVFFFRSRAAILTFPPALVSVLALLWNHPQIAIFFFYFFFRSRAAILTFPPALVAVLALLWNHPRIFSVFFFFFFFCSRAGILIFPRLRCDLGAAVAGSMLCVWKQSTSRKA